MSDVTNSPNMSMPIPVVGQDPGPQYATDINSCLSILDQHNHTPGYGVPITPDALDINSNLSMANNNLTSVKSIRFTSQVSPITAALPDLDCVYVSGVDLYYNDGSGNQIRITQSGGVAGSPGSISNLVAPASASYNIGAETFVWQSDVNTPANLDARSIVLRNDAANSKGLTLNPPSAMGSDISQTLPTLPAATSIMRMDTSGNMSANLVVDNSTIEINSNTLRVKDSGITTAKILDGAVTPAKLSASNIVTSSSCGDFATSASSYPSYVDVTNLSVSITTTGRPVSISLNAISGGINSSYIKATIGWLEIAIYRGATLLQSQIVCGENTSSGFIAYGTLNPYVDQPSANTYTYKIAYRMIGSGGGCSGSITNWTLQAREL